MIRVVGNLQNDEWQQRWERMRLNSECTLKTLEGKLKSLPTSTPYLLKKIFSSYSPEVNNVFDITSVEPNSYTE